MSSARDYGQAAQCLGKEAFASPALAAKIVARHKRMGRRSQSYRCPTCGKWHIGTPPRSVHTGRRFP